MRSREDQTTPHSAKSFRLMRALPDLRHQDRLRLPQCEQRASCVPVYEPEPFPASPARPLLDRGHKKHAGAPQIFFLLRSKLTLSRMETVRSTTMCCSESPAFRRRQNSRGLSNALLLSKLLCGWFRTRAFVSSNIHG